MENVYLQMFEHAEKAAKSENEKLLVSLAKQISEKNVKLENEKRKLEIENARLVYVSQKANHALGAMLEVLKDRQMLQVVEQPVPQQAQAKVDGQAGENPEPEIPIEEVTYLDHDPYEQPESQGEKISEPENKSEVSG